MNFVKGIQWRQGDGNTVRLEMKGDKELVVEAIVSECTKYWYKELLLFRKKFATYDDADKAYRRVVESFDQIYDEFGNEIEEDYEYK